MYIDTHTIESMEKNICDYLKIEKEELSEIFSKAPYDDGLLDIERFVEIIDSFILKNRPKEKLDEILFFHLTRRLISSNEDVTCYNLIKLLTTNNAISSFLKKCGIEFVKEKENLELYYKKSKIDISNNPYLKRRLGKDYCVNGFAFKENLQKNIYWDYLLDGPEFIQKLGVFLNCPDLCRAYCKNSKYFCYEYCIPIEKVIFDDKEDMSIAQKRMYLLERIILRLYNYNIFGETLDESLILRLLDNDMMQKKFFIKKEEIK